VKFAVGDLVVYRSHAISARQEQECVGETQEVVVLEFEQLT